MAFEVTDTLASIAATPPALIDPRPEVILPHVGKPLSEFADETGKIIGPQNKWFMRNHKVVDVRPIRVGAGTPITGFHTITPVEARSLIEKHIKTGICEDEIHFVLHSMNTETAAALLQSTQFKDQLPVVDRILTVPVFFLLNGKLELTNKGYDARLNSYCPQSAVDIAEVSLAEGKACLQELLQDFCFANALSVNLAIARLLTPMCRALMGWDSRPPVWLFEGNRPRAGKDYLGVCASLIYEGYATEDLPLETEGEETRKRIIAALQSGRRFMHFANCKGFINNSAFEHAATAKCVSGRALGSNDAAADLMLPNELEFSLSANTGFSFTEDFNLRCRKISLEYSEEDANGRKFSKPDLHGWIKENRSRILGSLAALIKEWDKNGRPAGPTPFTSFPEWGRIVGGILTCCDLGDPCLPQDDGLTGDTTTRDMKLLFEAGYERYPEQFITRNDLYSLMATDDGAFFAWFNRTEKSAQTRMGIILKQYTNRTLGAIQMVVDDHDPKRPRFKFTRQVTGTKKGVVQGVFDPKQDTKCPPRPPCPPLQPSLGTKNNDSNENHKLIGLPEVPKVAKVDRLESNPLPEGVIVPAKDIRNGIPPVPESIRRFLESGAVARASN